MAHLIAALGRGVSHGFNDAVLTYLANLSTPSDCCAAATLVEGWGSGGA